MASLFPCHVYVWGSEMSDGCALKLFANRSSSWDTIATIWCRLMRVIKGKAKGRLSTGRNSWSLDKPRLCDVSLSPSRSTEHQHGEAVFAGPAPAFLFWVVPEHMFSEYRAETKEFALHIFGGKHALLWWCFNYIVKLKSGERVCAKTEVWGKQCEVPLQASVFMLLLQVIDSSGFYVILYT